MAESPVVVRHREHLWNLLSESAQLEHMIMCEYLYAAFGLRTEVGEGLTEKQLEAVWRWQHELTAIAIQEMLHLALVCNVMVAIGAAPTFGRPNFPQRSNYFPPEVQLDLLPFGDAALEHFLFLERPEGVDRSDAPGFEPHTEPRELVDPDELMPRGQDFGTIGHLYRGIEAGLHTLAADYGEAALFVGSPRAQITPELLHWPQLVTVTDLQSAIAALQEIIEQGEGAREDHTDGHYGRFLRLAEEYRALRQEDPDFEPAHPTVPAFTRQPYDNAEPCAIITDPRTRQIAELFNVGYGLVLLTLLRLFTHTDETDDQLKTLAGVAIGLMGKAVGPLGRLLSTLPVGPEYPGRTAGPAFEMYYMVTNLVPWRPAAWALMIERADLFSTRLKSAGLDEIAAQAAVLAARLRSD
ncbi:ferritin-like protein [Nocardia sp. NPDC020380]|uniref:ferritin-like protein n=1 Tax=Nocardia sp. NPDC020380 TaxID=3364309 RepID=UPI0037A59812